MSNLELFAPVLCPSISIVICVLSVWIYYFIKKSINKSINKKNSTNKINRQCKGIKKVDHFINNENNSKNMEKYISELKDEIIGYVGWKNSMVDKK